MLFRSDSNFKIALDLLDSEFLNIPRLVHSLLDTILNSPVLSNNDLEGARLFLNETRSLLKDLQGHDLDLLEEDSAGLTLISHIIFSKLPSPLKKELMSVSVINHFSDILFRMDRLKPITKSVEEKVSRPKEEGRFKGKSNTKGKTWVKNSSVNFVAADSGNSEVKSEVKRGN